MTVRGPRHGLFTAVALAGLMAASACNLRISTDAVAKDQWQRRYTLKEGGTLEIRNTNGLTHIEPTTAGAVDITADRVVRAATDQAAKDALSRFEIQETVAPDRITIDSTNRRAGIMITLHRHVYFHVRAPRWANLTIDTTNGNVELVGPRLTGKLH